MPQTTMTANQPLNSRRQIAEHAKYLSGEIDAFGTTIFLILANHFEGLEWLEWEPDVLGQEIEDDFKVALSPEGRDRLWAVVGCLTSDRFYRDALFFSQVCSALSGEPLSMQVWEPPEVDEMAWAILEIAQIDTDDQNLEFEPEVVEFIRHVLRRENVDPYGPLEIVGELGIPMPDVGDPDFAAQFIQERDQQRESLMRQLADQQKMFLEQVAALGIKRIAAEGG